jgi:hypothetical protein
MRVWSCGGSRVRGRRLDAEVVHAERAGEEVAEWALRAIDVGAALQSFTPVFVSVANTRFLQLAKHFHMIKLVRLGNLYVA